MTLCNCTQPGWCERHQCHKTAHWQSLCHTRADYFQLWETGRGPGQSNPRNPATEYPCRYQGRQRREQQCASCRGTVRLKIFECELYDECTLAKSIGDVACCATCDDYERQTDPRGEAAIP